MTDDHRDLFIDEFEHLEIIVDEDDPLQIEVSYDRSSQDISEIREYVQSVIGNCTVN